MIPIQNSLKTRILLVTGSVILLIMTIISLAIMFQWRNILIEKEVVNAQSVTDAFIVPALDAMIYAEQRELLKDDLLETYIENFIQRVKNIKYIEIYDNNFEIIARKEKNEPSTIPLTQKDTKLQTNKFKTVIYQSDLYGWILDTYAPLEIARKKWGITKIGFDAEPIRSEIRNIFFILFTLSILISIATLSVLYLLIDRITFSLYNLVQQIDKIDFNSTKEIVFNKSKDEIGFLIERFNDLLKRLNKSKEQLALAQRQIYQSEKLASIGRLASGVAHEINNPLNGIKSCIYAIEKEPDNKIQTKEYLDLINEGIFYIENVTKKLLGFVRQQPLVTDSLELNELILNVYRLLEYKLKQKQANVTLDLFDNLPVIKGDHQLIQEVIMNLFLNSYDAIENNGIIKISTGIKDEKNIFLSISDNGVGIEDENLEKIYDPFYTTKEPGEGTGLGLWVTLAIVENHNGQITVNSIPNQQTTFIVTLPAEVS